MTRRKLVWLVVLFMSYEVLVWGLSLLFLPNWNNLLVGFVLTACGLTLAAVYWLVARLSQAANQANPQPQSTASAVPAPPVLKQEEDAAIASLIREANDRLKQSPTLARERLKSRLSDFPLYLVVGPEGSGKTSVFLAPKLDPELLAGQIYRESVVAPTRLGNIWFTRRTLVVEAAGVLFSSDAGRWRQLLGFLVSSRRKSSLMKLLAPAQGTNLSGVVLCCDVTAFLGIPDAARLAAAARLTQERLRTVSELCGSDVPVYVIFTKSDSIRGFGEYFGRLTESDDQQILGCSLNPEEGVQRNQGDVYAHTETARLSASLNRLYLSLVDKRLTFLAREADPAKKPAIYEFPREFKRIRSNLVQFLLEVFRPNPLQPNPVLRGIYFTGTRKVAAAPDSAASSMLDRTVIHKVGEVTRIFRLEDLQKLRAAAPEPGQREPEITRWAFAGVLWQQILSSGIAVGSSFGTRKEQFYRKGAFATAAAIFVILALLFLNSFFQNRALVDRVRSTISQIQPVPRGAPVPAASLRQLDHLRAEIDDLSNIGPSVFSRLGFYEGTRMSAVARDVYFARFREFFLNPVIVRLENDLSSLPREQEAAHPYQTVYGGLRVYRTVTKSSTEASCSPDSGLVEDWTAVWRQDRAADGDADRIARANIQFYLNDLKANRVSEEWKSPSRDDVVRRARDYLNAFGGVEPQYRQIIDQVNAERHTPARLTDLIHNTNYRSALRSPEEVPAAFTRGAWDRVQALIESAASVGMADSCVLGRGARSSALPADSDVKARLRDLYIKDYIQHWSEFLAKTNVLPYGAHACLDAAHRLDILKDNNSPILAALLLITENTTFPRRPVPSPQAAQTVSSSPPGLRELFGKLKDNAKVRVTKALGGVAENGGISEEAITSYFQPAHAVFETSPPNPEHWTDKRNTPYLDALGNLERAMQNLDRGGRCDNDPAANSQAMGELAKAQGVVDGLARGFDNQGAYEDVKRLLESPLRGLPIETDPTRPMKEGINGAQQQLCASLGGIRNKYPFDPQSLQDARLDAVASIFDPRTGQFAVLRQALGDQVMRTPGGWIQKPDAPVKLSKPFLDFLGRMSAISEALFLAQGGSPSAHYKLSVRPNPGIRQITGMLDGEPFSMSNKEYVWPAPQGGINLRVEQAGGGSTALRSYSGIWAVFQLLGNAEHEPGGNQFRLTNVQGDARSNQQPILPDGSPIVLEVTQFPNGIQHVFDRGFFNVSCPGRATD